MLTAARALWRRHRLLFLAFVVAIAVTVFFAVRLLLFTVYWVDPDHRRQSLEDWMTPRYVAHAYDLSLEEVREVLELEPGDGKRRTLAEIVETSELTLAEIQRRIDEAARVEGAGQD
jgi:hypothetical protein